MAVNACSFNVRGLGNKLKLNQMLTWLKTQSYNICLLQETHLTKEHIEHIKKEWDGEIYLSGTKTNAEGVCILFSSNISVKVLKHEEIVTGRFQSIDVIINEKEMNIINIYGPNTDDFEFYKKVEDYLLKHNENNFIIGGDFNTVINIDIDKKNGRNDTHKKCRNIINSIIETNNLIDIWRLLNPNKMQYTWHSNTTPIIFSRLDFFLISDNIVNYTNSCKIKAGYKSDHSLVNINLDLLKIQKGPGYFKLNNSVLLDTVYQNKIKDSIAEITEINKNANPNTIWELIKGTVRNETIKFTTQKKKMNEQQENELNNAITALEFSLQTLTEQISIDQTKEILDEKKQQLNDIVTNKINGIILRSKAQKVEYSEKNSNYFSRLEKKTSEKKNRLHN